ncbi:MAG: LacI family DNA-binding transcriptional regulator [bacterium]|nr:LacI family DNA-binding transcriptional regulator [bacterium]
MATLKDVAKESGLTVTTVSRVLNNRGYISEETRNKVYEAMKTLNYQPNEVARSLSKKKTNMIGLIVPHIKHPYFAELISCIESAANKNHYRILLFNTKEKNEKELHFMEMCKSNRVAGIILCSGTVAMEEFQGINVPLITLERNLDSGKASVECDNLQGGRTAAEHLIQSGCRHLIHISGVRGTDMPADAREQGFVAACEENGVRHFEYKTDAMQYNAGDYHDFITDILTKDPKVDGIFASSDLIAAQVIQVCAKLHRKIPQEIKLVGFDDVMISSLTTPQITTIHQPIQEMAEAAVSMLIQAGEGKEVPSKTTLPISLIVRETT